MKKIVVVLLLIIISFFIFWTIDYCQKDKNIFIVDNVLKMDVEKENISFDIYTLSYFNPFGKHKPLNVNIDMGYNEIDNIYVNGSGDNKKLIWTKANDSNFEEIVS